MASYKEFIFEGYDFDARLRVATLRYSYDGELHFSEQFSFLFASIEGYNQAALDIAVRGLWLMAGISYYKAYLLDTIVIRGISLTENEAAFYSRSYEMGLGELLYRNGLDVGKKIHFPSENGQKAEPEVLINLSGALVPLGGGKDSLLSSDILLQAGSDFTTWTVGHSDRFADMTRIIGRPHLAVERHLDQRIFDLNEQGAYNGHVPITGILAFAMVISAILSGKSDIVMSLEASAGEPTLVVGGIPVNHQYSKTLEFEKGISDYIHQNISPDINFFSILRPLTELHIAKLFSERLWDRFAGHFSSCNRNFGLETTGQLIWCGHCPKCAFVFLLFAPFVGREELIKTFDNKNPLADPNLHALYDDILGLTNEKPFECVGEVAEAREAMRLAQKTGNWPEIDRYQLADEDYDYLELRESPMPDNYSELLREYLANP